MKALQQAIKALSELNTEIGKAHLELKEVRAKKPTLSNMRKQASEISEVQCFLGLLSDKKTELEVEIEALKKTKNTQDEINELEGAIADAQSKLDKSADFAKAINDTIKTLHGLVEDYRGLGESFELSDFISAFTAVDGNLGNGFYRAVHGQGVMVQFDNYWLKQLAPGEQTPTSFIATLKEVQPSRTQLEQLEQQLNKKLGELEG